MQIGCSNDSTASAKLFTRKTHYFSQTYIKYIEDIFRLYVHQIPWLLLRSGYAPSAKSH